jgi:hypothetical protein
MERRLYPKAFESQGESPVFKYFEKLKLARRERIGTMGG